MRSAARGPDCPDPNCRGTLANIGGGRSQCGVCGKKTLAFQETPETLLASKCQIKGCPGHRDAAGKCDCCERREKWKLEHLIPEARACEICGGPAPQHAKKYCLACRPLGNRWETNKRKQKAAGR